MPKHLQVLFIKIGLVSIYVLTGIFALIFLFQSDDPRLEATVVLLTVLLGIVAAPPLSEQIEDFFESTLSSADEIRDRLHKYWFKQILYLEALDLPSAMGKPPSYFIEEDDWETYIEKWQPLSRSFDVEWKTTLTTTLTTTSTDIKEIFTNLSKRCVQYSPDLSEIMIIKGGKGGGRTTQMLLLAEKFINQSEARIPIYLNLITWQAGFQALDIWLIKEITDEYELNVFEAQNLITDSHFIFLFDGFEDLQPRRRRYFIMALIHFLQRRRTIMMAIGGIRDAVIISTTNRDGTSNGDPGRWLNSHNAELEEKLFEFLKKQQRDQPQQRQDSNNSSESPALAIVTIRELEYEDILGYLKNFLTKHRNMLTWDLVLYVKGDKALFDTLKAPFFLTAIPVIYHKNALRQLVGTTPDDIDDTELGDLIHINENEREHLRRVRGWQKKIARDYVETKLQLLPHRLRPKGDELRLAAFPQTAETQKVLQEAVKEIEELQRGGSEPEESFLEQREVFILEHLDVLTQVSGRDRKHPPKIYRGLVAFVSSILFPLIFLIFHSISPFTSIEQGLWIGLLTLFVFGRLYGWMACEDSLELRSKVRWFPKTGLIAGLFLSIMTGLIFRDVSCQLYQPVTGYCLEYEALVYSIFSFFLFTIIGGADFGRRYEVVTRINQGVRYLAFSMLLMSAFWVFFFFMFIAWPRFAVEILDFKLARDIIVDGVPYALFWGMFIGIISSLTFCHLMLRYLLSIWYLRRKKGIHSSFKQVLDYLVQAGLMYKLGGGYSFRQKEIMSYIKEFPNGR